MNTPDYMDSGEAATPESDTAKPAEDTNEGAVLVNKTLAPDAKPGDTFTVKVLHVYEDEISVAQADKEPEPEQPDELEPAAEPANEFME